MKVVKQQPRKAIEFLNSGFSSPLYLQEEMSSDNEEEVYAAIDLVTESTELLLDRTTICDLTQQHFPELAGEVKEFFTSLERRSSHAAIVVARMYKDIADSRWV